MKFVSKFLLESEDVGYRFGVKYSSLFSLRTSDWISFNLQVLCLKCHQEKTENEIENGIYKRISEMVRVFLRLDRDNTIY